MPDGLLTPAEAAAYLGVTVGTLYKLCYERRVPVVKIGRRSRFRRQSLERYAEKSERPAKR